MFGTGNNPIPATQRQRPGVYQPQLHRVGEKLWLAAGVHYAVHAGAKRHGRASDPDTERAMRSPAKVRDVTTCQSGDWRLDPVLQPEAPTSGAEDENAGAGIC